jgi:hypothetical protein
MKINLYTKVILTGIFACLCLIVLRDVHFESRAEAQGLGGTQDVRVVDWTAGDLDVEVEDWNASSDKVTVVVEEWNAGDLDVDIDDCYNCK